MLICWPCSVVVDLQGCLSLNTLVVGNTGATAQGRTAGPDRAGLEHLLQLSCLELNAYHDLVFLFLIFAFLSSFSWCSSLASVAWFYEKQVTLLFKKLFIY